jgi:hypothetical protein
MYVPQTYYRTYYRGVAVTAYQPVTSYDSCSGCAMTSYYPTTAWTYQPCLVPYTTYRVVYSPVVSCGPCASGCGCYSGGCCGSGCCSGGCGGGYSGSGCAACAGAAPAGNSNPAPAATDTNSGTTAPKTFAPGPVAPETTTPSAPAKAGDAIPPIPAEKPAAPDIYRKGTWQQPVAPPRQPTENRTTARPVYQTGYFQLIASPPKTAPIHDASLGDDGWHAARD